MKAAPRYAGGTHAVHETQADSLWLCEDGQRVSCDAAGRLPEGVRAFDSAAEAARVARASWPGSHGVHGEISDHDGVYQRVVTRQIPARD